MMRAVLVSMTLLACGGGFREALRHRAAADLSCAPGAIVVTEIGAGGWRAAGCERRARYVCSRGSCTLDGEVSGPDDAATTSVELSPWRCRLVGVTAADAARIPTALSTHAAALATCRATGFALGLGRGLQIVQVLAVDGDDGCVRSELAGASIESEAGTVVRCDLAAP